MSTVNLAEHKSSGVKTNQIPPNMSDRYAVRVKSAKFGNSNSGKPMITLDCEIFDPQQKEFEDGIYDLTSIKLAYYLLLENSEKRDNLKILKEFYEKMGFPLTIDVKNPDLSVFDRLAFDAVIHSRDKVKQRRTATGAYEPVTDRRGQPVKLGFEIAASIEEVIEKIEAPGNVPAGM